MLVATTSFIIEVFICLRACMYAAKRALIPAREKQYAWMVMTQKNVQYDVPDCTIPTYSIAALKFNYKP